MILLWSSSEVNIVFCIQVLVRGQPRHSFEVIISWLGIFWFVISCCSIRPVGDVATMVAPWQHWPTVFRRGGGGRCIYTLIFKPSRHLAQTTHREDMIICPGLGFRAGLIMPQRLLQYAVEFMDRPNINLYLFINIDFNIFINLCNGWLFGLAQEIEFHTELSVINKLETDASN